MARMIPSDGPRPFHPGSDEDKAYEELQKLPNDYFVIHSFKFRGFNRGKFEEKEIDFVVFHHKLGLLCLEVKNGERHYRDGCWYNSRNERVHDPYEQAEDAMNALRDRARKQQFTHPEAYSALNRCKTAYAVWFLSIDRETLEGKELPARFDPNLTLTSDDWGGLDAAIQRIFRHEFGGKKQTALTREEAGSVVKHIICPEFSLVPSARFEYDLENIDFIRLLDEQVRVLNFIEEQPVAVISGMAGTGKTLIAVERAKRMSEEGEKVLLLCFNSLLRDDLERRCRDHPNITVSTISKFACDTCHTSKADYEALADELYEMGESASFPYRHLVIDEGQDFESKAIDEADLLEYFKMCIEAVDGTMIVFYDGNQSVQSGPARRAGRSWQGDAQKQTNFQRFLSGADCKLSLFVNCRNTEKISSSSLGALDISSARKRKYSKTLRSVEGSDDPEVLISEDAAQQERYVDSQIRMFKEAGLKSIVVLSCKSLNSDAGSKTAFFHRVESRTDPKGRMRTLWSGTDVPFYTCRTFKGLEAEAVILVDVTKGVWLNSEGALRETGAGQLLYTGASRAKHALRIVCDMNKEDCREAVAALGEKGLSKPYPTLRNRLKAQAAIAE